MPRSISLFLHSLKLAVIGIGRHPAPYISAFVGFLIVMMVSTVVLGVFNGLQATINKSGSNDIAVIWASQGGVSEEIVRDLYQVDAVARDQHGPLLMRAFVVPIQIFLDGRKQLTGISFLVLMKISRMFCAISTYQRGRHSGLGPTRS